MTGSTPCIHVSIKTARVRDRTGEPLAVPPLSFPVSEKSRLHLCDPLLPSGGFMPLTAVQ